MHTGPASRPLGNSLAFTSRNQCLGIASSHAANQPRELATAPRRKSLVRRVALLSLGLLFSVAVVLALAVAFLLFGQQWRSGADTEPEPHEASQPTRPWQWANETN